jgi:hypothetical protein
MTSKEQHIKPKVQKNLLLKNYTVELRYHFTCPTHSYAEERSTKLNKIYAQVGNVPQLKHLSDPMCMVPMCSGPPSGLMFLQQRNCGRLSTATFIFVVACSPENIVSNQYYKSAIESQCVPQIALHIRIFRSYLALLWIVCFPKSRLFLLLEIFFCIHANIHKDNG